MEITVIKYQHYQNGKHIKVVDCDYIIDKSYLDSLAQEIAEKENIPLKELFLIYKEKINYEKI